MKATERPRYSILIPTRNGCRYLPYAIDSVLSQESDDFELIVSDNHSSDGTAEYLDGLTDPRIVRLKPDTELSMTHHFEFILSHASGEWVTAIGDDDAVMPFFFEYLEQLDLDRIDVPAITFSRAYYFWDGCQELYEQAVASYQPSSRKHYSSNSLTLFLGVCSIVNYSDMPQLYTTGIVRNEFIRSVKERSNGLFFHSTAPDAGSAAILALNTRRHYRVDQPVFWTGTSPKSVGYSQGSSVTKERSEEHERQNKSDGLKYSTDLPPELYKNIDLSVLLYDAIMLSPTASKTWSTSLMRNFFISGLLVKGGESRNSALVAYDGSMLWIRLSPYIAIIRIIKMLHKWRFPFTRRGKKHRLRSNDRDEFPTIKHASEAVSKRERPS